MNLRKLSKEKRQQLVLVAMLTLMALSGLGFGLIRYQYQNLTRLADAKASTEKNLQLIGDSVKNASRRESDLAQAKKALAEAENDIASGDLYSWVINALRQFKAGYNVEIPQLNPIGPVSEVTMLPGFPYKQVTLTVAGTAHFDDLGRFLANFENHFPHIRVLNLNLEPNPSPVPEDVETLLFKMDIVTLVKSAS
jgi:hypothetical protein